MKAKLLCVLLGFLLMTGAEAMAQVNVDLNAGAASAPSLTFYNDTTTGLYQASSGSHTLNFSSDAAEVAAFNSSGDFNLTNAGGTSLGGFQINGATVLGLPDGDTTSIAVGESALVDQSMTSLDNTALGNAALEYATTATYNTAVGTSAMQGTSASPMTNSYNTAVGYQALVSIQGAARSNTAVGANAERYLSTATWNIAVGGGALGGTSATPLTGNSNTGVGQSALGSVQGTATLNTAIGFTAGDSTTTGAYNTALGASALYNNTTGSDSAAVGYQALYSATGSPNTALGYEAGYSLTTGTDNTLVGSQAGYDVTGSHNIILGEDPSGAITSGSSNILIGNSLTEVTNSTSKQLDIGDTIYGAMEATSGGTALTIGTSSDTGVTLTIAGEGSMIVPAGTTAERPSSTTNGQIRYNSTLDALEAYVDGAWATIAGGGGSAAQVFSSGRLLYDTTTEIQYCPYKGNLKTTASYGTYTMPSGCLTGTITSMYIGGTAAQSAAASTLYYVYLINVSGTTYLDLETTVHATDSTTGIEIESGDNTKTLVGMIHTDASSKIASGDSNTVATWDNRQPTSCWAEFSAQRTTTSTSLVEINSENRCSFMSWGDAAAFFSEQYVWNSVGDAVTSEIKLDDGTIVSSYEAYPGSNTTVGVLPAAFTPTEGYHYAALYGSVVGGTGTWAADPWEGVLTVQ
jgi:hypothetical protein